MKEKNKKRSNNLFEEFKELFEGEEEFKFSSPFMMNRLLSLSKEGFIISVIANQFIGRVSNKLLYLIYKKYIGKQRVPSITYPKKEKRQEEILLSKICSFFNCNQKHGRQIISIYRNNKDKPEELFGLKPGE